MVYQSSSSEATKNFAASLAKEIIARGPNKKGALILALEGDLGAGKTTFVQGFFKGLGIKRVPNSPTFILMRRTRLPGKKTGAYFKNIYHVDAYRIKDAKNMSALGFKELLEDSQNIFLIEWPGQISTILPRKKITLRFSHGKNSESRSIKVSPLK